MHTICNTPEVFEALIHKAATEQQALQVHEQEEDDSLELYPPPSLEQPVVGQAVPGLLGSSALSPDLCQKMHALMCLRRRVLNLPQLGEGPPEMQKRAVSTMWEKPKQAFIASLLA